MKVPQESFAPEFNFGSLKFKEWADPSGDSSQGNSVCCSLPLVNGYRKEQPWVMIMHLTLSYGFTCICTFCLLLLLYTNCCIFMLRKCLLIKQNIVQNHLYLHYMMCFFSNRVKIIQGKKSCFLLSSCLLFKVCK